MRFMACSAENTSCLKPAVDGTGIIAGGAVRAVVELVGAHNVISKTLGRGNPFNTVRATLDGLTQLRNPEEVMRFASAVKNGRTGVTGVMTTAKTRERQPAQSVRITLEAQPDRNT